MNIQSRPTLVGNPSLSKEDARDPTMLIAQDPNVKKERSVLEWWYRLTSQKEPPENAPLLVRERARRGRLISTVMFFASVLFMMGTFIGVFGPNHFIAYATTFSLVLLAISSQFNRLGYTNVAGLIIPLGFNAALVAVVFSSPLTPTSIQLYDLLVFVEVFAASFLPSSGWLLALFAIGNIIFIEADITLQAHTAAFAAIMATDSAAIRIRPVIIHIVITGVIWLWVRSASLAIARADRAEVIAKLEHIVAEQERSVAQEKQQLDASIQTIVDTHIRVANGDLSSRVPLASGNVLWQVAGPLNNLLSRFQRMHQEVREGQRVIYELRRTREALAQALYLIRSAKAGRHLNSPTQTGTLVDTLLQEMEPLLKKNDSSEYRRLP
jgi:uncharacterized coiled-coil protein SlyX